MSFVCPSRTLRDKTAQILLPPAGECGVDIHYRVGGEAAGAADPLLLSDFDDARALPQLGRLLNGGLVAVWMIRLVRQATANG